jgi:hypothetical protein
MNEAEIADEVGFVEVVDPAHEAFQLRMTGLPWREVAVRTGYRTEANATMAVRRYLARGAADRHVDERAEDYRLAIERHEAVLAAWWDKANVDLNPKAAIIVLRCLNQLNVLQRLTEPEVSVKSEQTIVIAGSPEQYAAKMRAIAEGRIHELEAELEGETDG